MTRIYSGLFPCLVFLSVSLDPFSREVSYLPIFLRDPIITSLKGSMVDMSSRSFVSQV